MHPYIHSLQSGILPDSEKSAAVTPIIKKPVVKGTPQGKADNTARLQTECVSPSQPVQPGDLSTKNIQAGVMRLTKGVH